MIRAIWRTGIHITALVLLLWLGRDLNNFIEFVGVQIIEIVLILVSLYSILFITYIRASNNLYEKQKTIQDEKDNTIKEKEVEIKRLETAKSSLKIYKLPSYSVARIPPRNQLQNNYVGPIVAWMKFCNQPIRMSDEAIANKVAIQLIACDTNWNPFLDPINGIWKKEDDLIDVFSLKDGLNQVNFEPNGLPHETALIFKVS